MSSADESISKLLRDKAVSPTQRAISLNKNAATLAKCSQAIKKEAVKFLVDKLESCTVESLSVFLELANAVAKACHTEFSSSFTDVGDILLGWRLHPDLVANKQKLTDRIEASMRQFGRYWTAHAEFSMNMLRIIGADIDTTVQSYIQRPAKALSDKLVGFFDVVFAMSGGLYRSKIVVDMAPALIQAAKRATVSVGRTDVRAAAARMVSSVGKMARQSDQDLYLASVTFFEESLLHAEDAGMVCTQLMYLHKFLVPPAVLALLMRPGGVCWIVRTFGAMLSQHTVQEFFDVLLASNPRDFFRELLPQAAAFVSHLRGTQPSGQPGGLAWMPFVEKLSSSEAARQLSFSLTLLLSAVQKTKDYDTSQLLSLGELVGGMAKVSLQNFPTLHLYAIATVWQIDEHARRKGRSVPQCMEVGLGLICSAIETEGTSTTVVKYCFGALVNMASQGLPVGTPEDLDRVVSACCLYTCSGASNTAPAVQIIASLLRAGGRSLSGSVVVDVFLAARHLALVSEKMPEACLLLEQSYPLLQTPLHNVPTPEGKLSVVLSQLPASGVFDDQQFSGVMARLRLRNASAGLTKEWSRTLFFSCRIPTLLRLLDAEQWTRSKIDAHLGAGVLNRWVVEEAAKFCVTSKLRTPLGDPMQTLEAIEGMLLEADKDCGISEGVKQSTLRDLLLFVDAMEKHILMASEGCGASRGVMIPSDRLEELREDATGVRSTKRAGASASEVFFSANRKVCVDWFSRMRQGLLLASLTSGEPYEIVRHSSQRLKDILRGSHGGKNAEEVRTNLETTLLTLSSALVNIREPDAITGLLEYFCSSKRPGQMFSKLLGKEAADGFATLLRSQSLKAASMFETAASEMMPLISSSATVQQSKEVVQFILEESLDCYKNLSDWSSLDQWQEARESTGIEISLPDVELVKCLRALDSGVATECLSHVESSPAFLGQSEAISFCERMLVRSLSGAERHTADLKAVQEVCLARLRILADAMASREYETLSIFSHLSSSLLVKEQRNDTSDTLLPTAPFQGHSLYEPFAAQWVERCFGGTLEREIPRLVSQAHHSGNAAYASRLTAMLPAASFERPMLEVESLQGSFEEETKAILAALSTYASLDADADMDSAELENRRSKLFSMLAARLCAAKADECDPSDLLSLLKDDESFSSGESCDEADLSSFIASSFEHAVATSNPSLTACFSFAQWSWRQGKELMNDEGLDDEATAELEAAFNGASIPDESISSIVLSAVEEALCEWRSTPSADLPTTADFEERLRSMGATEQMLSGDDFTTVSTKAHTALAHAVQRRVAHHRGAGKHYFQALQLIDSSESEAMDRSEVQLTSCLQLLRLMTEAWPLHDEFTEAIKATPAAAWLQVLPQIIARLSHPDVSVRQLLGELLSRIAESFPQDVIFPVVVRLNMERTKEEASGYAQEWLQKIADNLGAGHPKLYSQVQNFVRELTRVTLLWHEEGYALLSKVQSQDWECRVRAIREVSDVLSRRVLAGELDNASAEDLLWQKYGAIMEHVIDRLSAFELVISRAPETPLEVQFQKSFLDRFQTALATLCSPLEPSEPEQCWTAFEELAVEFGRLQKPSQLKLSMLSPGLGKFTSSDIEMPTSHASPDGSVTIAKIEERVVVIATKTKPKKLQFRGSDGKAYHYLLKGREDLNLDARIMQFFTAVNGLLRNSSKPYSVVQRKLRARNYAVVPLAERSGLIQWVEGQVSLFQVWKQWQTNNVAVEAAANPSSAPPAQQRPTEIFYSHLAPALAAHNDSLSESCDRRRAVDATPAGRKDWPHSVLKSVFLSLKADSPADLLAQELWCSSASNAGWWQKQKDFAQSLAVTSMIGYCLGVGDRHLDNILLDACSGEVLHIDFNVCFDRGSKLRVPETVPFRLTQLLERGLGVTGVAGAFKESSKVTLQTLRDHRHMLLALLEVFVYEPLTEWTQSKSALRHRSKVELAVALEHLSAKVELTTQTMHESIAELGTAFKSYVEEFCAVVDERGGPAEVSALRAPTEEEAAAAVEQTTRLPEEEEEADLGKAREEDEEEEEESLEVLLEDLQACEQEVEEYVRLMADSRLRFRELTAGAPKQLLESCQSEQARLEKSLEVVHGRHLFMLREYLQKTQSVALLVSLQRLYARQPPPAAIAGQDAFAERILSERLIAADKNSLECIRILLRVAEITKGAQPQYRLRNRCHDWIQVLTKALDTEALSDNEIDDLNLSRSLEGEKAALATYLDAAEAHSEQLQSLALLEETVSEAEAKKALNATKVEEAMSLLVNHNIEVVHSNSGVQVVGLVRLIDLSARLRSVIQENGSIATASDDSSFASAGDDCDQKLVDAVSDITASVGLIMDVQRQHFEGWQKGCVPPPWTAAWQVGSEDVRRSVLEMTSADFDLEDFHLIAPPTVQQLVSIQKGLAENLDLLIKLEELDFVAHQKLSTAENFLATSGTVRPGGMPKSHWQQQRRQAREEVAVISARNTTLQRSVNSLIARVETLFAANQQEPSFAALFSLFPRLEAAFSKFVVFLKTVGVNHRPLLQQKLFYCSKIDLLLTLHGASAECANDPRTALLQQARAKRGIFSFVKKFLCTLFAPLSEGMLALVVKGYTKSVAPSVEPDATPEQVREFLFLNYGRTIEWDAIETAFSLVLSGKAFNEECEREIRSAEEALTIANGEAEEMRQRQLAVEVIYEDALVQNVKGFKPQIAPLLNELEREVRQLQQVATLGPLVNKYLQRVQELVTTNAQALPAGAVAEMQQRAQCLMLRVRDLTGFLQVAAAVMHFESLRCSSSSVTRSFEERVLAVVRPLRDQLKEVQGTAAGAQAAEERLRVAQEEFRLLKEAREKEEREKEREKEEKRRQEEERQQKERERLEKERLAKEEQQRAVSEDNTPQSSEPQSHLGIAKERLQKQLASFWAITGEELDSLLRKVSRQYDALEDSALERVAAVASSARSEQREVNETFAAFLSASSPLLKSTSASPEDLSAAKATAKEMSSAEPIATLRQFHGNFTELGPLANALHARWLASPAKEDPTSPAGANASAQPAKKQRQNLYALGVLKRVRSKLQGRVAGGKQRLPVASQVDHVIDQATSPDNLCQMYEGWTPWI